MIIDPPPSSYGDAAPGYCDVKDKFYLSIAVIISHLLDCRMDHAEHGLSVAPVANNDSSGVCGHLRHVTYYFNLSTRLDNATNF